MDPLSKDDLTNTVNFICSSYSKFLLNEISQKEASESIGFLLSHLSKHEKEEGLDPMRIICVLPRCAPIIKLRITYNIGGIYHVMRLDLEPHHINTYHICTNSLTELEDSTTLNPDMYVDDDSSILYVCPYKNLSCCYTNNNHLNDCNNCCLNLKHHPVSS